MQRPSTPLPDAPPLHKPAFMDTQPLANIVFKGIEFLMALLLVAMIIMVLGNVILRYGFDSGISAGEELSRTSFVWLTFIGAVVAAREGTHLGVDTLLRRLRGPSRLAVAIVGELFVLLCCALMLRGTWIQHEVNATTRSLVTGMPLIWVFGILYVTGVGIGLLSLAKLWRMFTGRATEKDILGANHDNEGDAL